MNITLGGHPLDPTVTMRLEDFQNAISAAANAAREPFLTPEKPPGFKFKTPNPAPVPVVAKKAAAPVKRVAVVALGGGLNEPRVTIQAVILDHLKGGACTRVELLKAVSQKTGSTTETVDVTFSKCKQRELIEKFEDHANGGLLKWRLKK
jgi:hypothetical protein